MALCCFLYEGLRNFTLCCTMVHNDCKYTYITYKNTRRLLASDLPWEGSWFESGGQLFAEVTSLQ